MIAIAATSRADRWASMSEDALLAYASQWEDMAHDICPDDLDWVYVDVLPVPFSANDRDWPRWWKEQQADAKTNGLGGLWDNLLTEEVREPVVLGLYGREGGFDLFGFCDGNHRVAAAIVSGRGSVPAVVGIERDIGLDDLPPRLRGIPEIIARIEARVAAPNAF